MPRTPIDRRGRSHGEVWTARLRLLQGALTAVMTIAVAADIGTQLFVAHRYEPLTYLGALLTAGGIVALRRAPWLAVTLFAAGPVVAAVTGAQGTALWSVACFAALLLTLRGTSGWAVAGVLATANLTASWISTGTINPQIDSSATVSAFVALLAAAWGVGLRNQQRYLAAAQERADAAEATRQITAERSVAQERVRIAQDLHDGVGHQIAVVSVHVAAAQQRLRTDPDAATEDLAAARVAIKQVLLETQQILRVLRVGDDTGPNGPVADHRNIPDLLRASRAAGLTIEATTADLPDLPAGLSAAVYRIVQEILTNAHKHSTGTLTLTITTTTDIVIDAVNVPSARASAAATTSAAPTGGGRGLIGILERAESVGGTAAFRTENNLFWVHVTLPAPNGAAA